VGVFVAVVGAQAFLFSQVGLRVGARLGERAAERAERLAGLALLGLAAVLVASRL
jgi:putative Mn2+ efflux pump MntP